MKRTPLYLLHKRRGAIFGEWAGHEVPLKFGDPEGEELAARTSAALFDLSPRGKLRLEGADRADFLHRTVPSDVRALPAGRAQGSMFLSPKGKLVADFSLLALAEGYLLDVEPAATARLAAEIEKYVIADDVRVADESERFALLSIHGPKAAEIVALEVGEPVSRLEVDSLVEGDLFGAAGIARRTSRFGVPGFDLYVTAEKAAEGYDALRSHGAKEAGLEAHEALRIESGIPRFGMDLDEDTLPPEAGLEPLISYTKGCYVGQETIARIKYQGHVNRSLAGVSIDAPEPPPRFTALYSVGPDGLADKEVGRLTSACRSARRRGVTGLAILRRGASDPGTPLRARLDSGDVAARVEALPFYSPSDAGAAAPTGSSSGHSMR